jgi:transposase InsO family protein
MTLKQKNNRGLSRYNVPMNLTYPYGWRALTSWATLPQLSKEAKQRLKWMDYHRKCQNVAQTCRYFGIAPKTFYHWKKRYNPWKLESLESRSRKPKNTRDWEVSRIQEFRVLTLRRAHLRYGKMKLKVLYQQEYHEPISSWKIQKVIEKHELYYHPAKTIKLRLKRLQSAKKQRISTLIRKAESGFLIALDTVIRYWNGTKRYIFTAIDVHSKIAFARMYTTKSSKNAEDFLLRIHYLLDGKIMNITRDNGTEFRGYFEEALAQLKINGYYSRVKTPTDNPVDERFNRTLDEEFIQMGNMNSDCVVFNRKLTEWLIEYNFKRPHQSLDYLVPVEYHNKNRKVLPMYSSSTKI